MPAVGELGLRDFDDSWGYTHQLASPSDTGIVCDWSGTDSPADDLTFMPTCAKATCPEHGEFDTLPFGGFVESDGGKFYTNAELMAFVHPQNDDLPVRACAWVGMGRGWCGFGCLVSVFNTRQTHDTKPPPLPLDP